MCTIVYALSYHLHHIQVRLKVDDVIIHAGVHAVFSAVAPQGFLEGLILYSPISEEFAVVITSPVSAFMNVTEIFSGVSPLKMPYSPPDI